MTSATGLGAVSTVLLVAAGVVGCGGGSGGAAGGGGSGSGPSTAGPSVAITTHNAFDVGSAVVRAVSATFDLANASGGQVSPGASAVVPGAFGPETTPCNVSGTVTQSGDLADPPTRMVGDRMTATFDDCIDVEPLSMDGGLNLVVRHIQGDPLTDVFLLTLDLTLTNLGITGNTGTVTTNGDVTLTLDSLDFPSTLAQIAGSSLELASASGVYTLTGFHHFLNVDATGIPATWIAQAVGTLDSDLLAGTVDYETVTPVQTPGDGDPDTGEIVVNGVDSTMHIVIVDGAYVRLDIDVDGDGTTDDSQITNWAALAGEPSAVDSSTAMLLAREVLKASYEFGAAAYAVGGQFAHSNGGPFRQIAEQGLSGTFGPVDVRCSTTGTATVSGTIAIAGTYSSGDELHATYYSCGIAGAMDVTVGAFTGSATGPYVFSGAASLTTIQGSVRDWGRYTITADLSITFDATNLLTRGSFAVNGSATAAFISSGSITRLLSNATVQETVDFSGVNATTLAASGNLVTSLLNGRVAYESVRPFVTYPDGDRTTGPSSGEMLITASDGSSVRLVTMNNVYFRLDIDLDGDGVVDQSATNTWHALVCNTPDYAIICRLAIP